MNIRELSGHKYFPVSLIILSFVLLLLMLTPGHDWGDDFASYIMQAQAMVNGEVASFFQENEYTIRNSTDSMGPIAYPWGFPALLAPVYAIFGTSLLSFKVVDVILYLMLLIYLWRGFCRPLNRDGRMFLLAAFCLNPYMLNFLNDIGSDVPFLFFSTVGLGMMSVPAEKGLRAQALHMVLLGLAMGAAYSVRTNGILLPLVYLCLVFWSLLPDVTRAWLGEFADLLSPLRSRSPWSRTTLLWLPLLVFGMTAVGTPLLLPDGQSSHVDLLKLVTPATIGSNLLYYIGLLHEFFFPFEWGMAIGIALYGLTAVFVFRGVRIAGRQTPHMLVYAALTLALFALWPFRQGLRFMFPLLPIYVYFLSVGLFQGLAEGSKLERFSKIVAIAVPAVFCIASLMLISRNIERGWLPPNGPYRQPATEMFAYVRKATRPDEIIAFRKPRAMRMITGRNSVRILDLNSFDRVDLYVVDKTNRSGQIKARERELLLQQRDMDLVFDNEGFLVYRFRHQ